MQLVHNGILNGAEGQTNALKCWLKPHMIQGEFLLWMLIDWILVLTGPMCVGSWLSWQVSVAPLNTTLCCSFTASHWWSIPLVQLQTDWQTKLKTTRDSATTQIRQPDSLLTSWWQS